jgi:hypothetical protein
VRRTRIVQENFHRDPENWEQIKKIICDLGVPGMSGDETEMDVSSNISPNVRKTVRRSRIPWISSEISDLLHIVDSYDLAAKIESMALPRGNTMLTRLTDSRRDDKSSRAVGHLPRNFYDDGWYQAQTAIAKHHLNVEDDIPIPKLVSTSLRLNFLL